MGDTDTEITNAIEARIDAREADAGHPAPPPNPFADGVFAAEVSLTPADLAAAEGPDGPDYSDATAHSDTDAGDPDGAPPINDPADGRNADAAAPPPATKPADTMPADDKAGPPAWDKDRQTRDQYLADARKENRELHDRLARLEGQVAAGRPGEAKGPAGDDPDLDEIDPLDTEEDVGRKFNALSRRLRAAETRGQAAEDRETQRANQEALAAVLNEGAAQYGEAHRNEVLQRAREVWAEQGFDTGQLPDGPSARALILGTYAQVHAAALQKKFQAAGATKPAAAGPRTAPATRGRPAARGGPRRDPLTLTTEQAWEDIQAEQTRRPPS